MKFTNTAVNRKSGGTVFTALLILFLLTTLNAWGQENGRRPYPAGYRPDAIPSLRSSQVQTLRDGIPVSLPYSEDFESGALGWISDGFYHLKENPQHIRVLNPLINPNMVRLPDAGYLPAAHSGSGVMWFGEDTTGTFIGSDFDPDQEPLSGGTSVSAFTGNLISPEIDLTGVLNAQLEFFTWWEIEGVDANAYDMMYVDVSTDGGVTFIILGTLNPLNDLDGEPYVSFTNSGLGEPAHWGKKIFDLSAFAGDHILIRFRFETVDELYNGFRGWLIDDVAVTEGILAAPQIAGVEPDRGIVESMFMIQGDDFANSATVFLGDTPIPSSVLNTQSIQCQVPYLPTGVYDVAVENPNGLADTLYGAFSVTEDLPPLIVSVDPSETYIGEPVTISISGENFHPSAVPYVGGEGSPDHSWVDSTLIRCLTPAGLGIGTHNVKVVNPDEQYDLLVDAFTVSPHGTALSGYVTDAFNAQPVEGAVVTLATVSDTTDSEGYYLLSDVPAGELTAEFMATPTAGEVPLTVNFMDLSTSNTQTVTAAAEGYMDYFNTQVPVFAGEENILNISLSPEIGEGEMRFVLTWDDDPADLDSHLKTPPIDGTSYHVYYAAKGDSLNPPFARLDVDDVTGYGPETITLYETFDGTYYYYIYKYSGYEEITQSNAVVNIYDNTGLVQTLQVPTTGIGRFWNIGTIDGASKHITLVNRIQETEPGIPSLAAAFPKSPEYLATRSGTGVSVGISTWEWDFGDGEGSTVANPEHIYTEPGSYTVSLTVSDGVNQRTRVRENHINAFTGNDISLTVASAEGYAGITVDIPVIVNSGFSNVGMLDLQLQYDTTMLHLVDIGSEYLSPGDMNAAEDRINAVWVYPGTALEIPDGDTLMLLHFGVNGSVMEGDHSLISFSGNNLIAAPDESLFDLELSNGVFSGLMTPYLELHLPDETSLREDYLIEIGIDYNAFPDTEIPLEINAAPEYLALNADSSALTGIPGNRDVGLNTLSVTAYDIVYGGQFTETITYTVENAPCEIRSLPPIAILTGMEYVYDVNADDENEGAVYSYLQGPAFLSIDDSTGVLSGISDASYVGSHYMRVMVDDGNGSTDIQEWMLSILPANDEEEAPPVLGEFPPFIFNEDDTSSLILLDDYVEDADTPDEELEWLFIVNGNEHTDLYALLYDDDGTSPRTKSSVLGLNVLYHPETRELAFYGEPDWYGETMVTVVVTDGDRLAVGYIPVTVLNVNDAPHMIPFTNVVFLEDAQSAVYDLSAYIQDIDNTFSELDIEVTGNTDISFTLLNGSLQFSAAEDWNGQEMLTLSASDAEYTASCEFLVVVVPVNDPPQSFALSSPSEGEVIDTSFIRFNWGTAVDVDENDIVTYSLTVTDADLNVILETETEATDFSWDSPLNGNYEWKVEARDIAEAVTESETRGFTVDVLSMIRAVPAEFALLQNYPNPFNPLTCIQYGLPHPCDVRLSIFDISGRRVREWHDGTRQAGWHEVVWDGRNHSGRQVSTGIYIYMLQAGNFTETRKMLFMK